MAIKAVTDALLALESGVPLADCLKVGGVPLPTAIDTANTATGEGRVAIFYTDLEPDDIIAIGCLCKMLAPTMAGPPVIVYTVDMEEKDAGGVYSAKLVMAASALGQTLIDQIIVVSGVDKDRFPEPPPPYAPTEDMLRVAVTRTLQRAGGKDGIDIYQLAPGRGNIAGMFDIFKENDATWESLKGRIRVSAYTGGFNMLYSTPEDHDRLAAFATHGGQPLRDLAHFKFTAGRANSRLNDLHTLLPNFSQTVGQANPYLQEAWSQFSARHNGKLIRPDHPKLWDPKKEPLTSEEQVRFASIALEFDTDLKRYSQRTREDAGVWDKVAGYKQNTFNGLADGALGGPLCDCLIFLTMWLEQTSPEAVVLNEVGGWEVDADKGFTRVLIGEKGLCDCVQPYLADPKKEVLGETLDEALRGTAIAVISCC